MEWREYNLISQPVGRNEKETKERGAPSPLATSNMIRREYDDALHTEKIFFHFSPCCAMKDFFMNGTEKGKMWRLCIGLST